MVIYSWQYIVGMILCISKNIMVNHLYAKLNPLKSPAIQHTTTNTMLIRHQLTGSFEDVYSLQQWTEHHYLQFDSRKGCKCKQIMIYYHWLILLLHGHWNIIYQYYLWQQNLYLISIFMVSIISNHHFIQNTVLALIIQSF